MKRRPRSITIIGWLFIILGSVSLVSGLLPVGDSALSDRIAELKDHWYVHLVRILAIVGGLFLLKGHGWARWLLVAWMAFHIALSAMHSVMQLVLHTVIFSVICFFLFKPKKGAVVT
jgi:uncharacterized membrane protein